MKPSTVTRRVGLAMLIVKAEKMLNVALNPNLTSTRTFNHRLHRYARLYRLWRAEKRTLSQGAYRP